MRVPDSIIDQLNAQADLVSIIRKHTTLKPRGREFLGCCPFHGEKTPSFNVNPQTNLYYCFGCQAKGNAITFLKEFERLSFMEALQVLSEQTGIEIPKDDDYQKKISYKKSKPKPNKAPPKQPMSNHTQAQNFHLHTPPAYHQEQSGDMGHWQADIAPQEAEQGDLYQLLANICRYYQQMLHQNPMAMDYFVSRGLSPQTIATFELGYAPNDWQHLEKAFPQDIEGLKILGLVRISQSGKEFDLLRHRVIFPIKDSRGRVVGFSGRSLGDEMPKYVNSSDSPVFHKQHILYGMYEARQAKTNRFMMVEGYMDVIALHQAGIYGAVASMGTATNENQISKLLKYNDELTLCFDGDSAGQKAAWRTLEIAAPVLSDDKRLRFLTLPDNHDPDTYIKQHGTKAMQEQIDGAISIADYVFWVLSLRYDLTLPENKAAAMADTKELCNKFPKGSSFKSWLNRDIFQRLGERRKHFVPKAIDPANYTQQNDGQHVALQLCLCLLYDPTLLCQDPLADALQKSGVAAVPQEHLCKLTAQQLSPPEIPTWQHLQSPLLSDVVDVIFAMQTHPQTIAQSYAHTQLEHPDDIQRRACFILAALSPQTAQSLSLHWTDFFHHTQHQPKEHLQLLFSELLYQKLYEYLQSKLKQSKNIVLSQIYKNQLKALTCWNQKIKQQVSTLLSST